MVQLEGGKITQYKVKKQRNSFLMESNGHRHFCENEEEEGSVTEMFGHWAMTQVSNQEKKPKGYLAKYLYSYI